MLEKQRKLDAISGKLFAAGLIVGKGGQLKIPIFASICSISSSLLYLLGYIAWQLAVDEVNKSRETPILKLKKAIEEKYKHLPQYNISATLGIFASIAMLGALAFPTYLGLISAWLFLSSNIFWLWGENIQINQLREIKPESGQRHAKEYYYQYALLATLTSAITALSLTVCFIFPLLTIPLTTILATNLIALNLFALQNWAKCTYYSSNLAPDDEINEQEIIVSESYQKMLGNNPLMERQPNPVNDVPLENKKQKSPKEQAAEIMTFPFPELESSTSFSPSM